MIAPLFIGFWMEETKAHPYFINVLLVGGISNCLGAVVLARSGWDVLESDSDGEALRVPVSPAHFRHL